VFLFNLYNFVKISSSTRTKVFFLVFIHIDLRYMVCKRLKWGQFSMTGTSSIPSPRLGYTPILASPIKFPATNTPVSATPVPLAQANQARFAAQLAPFNVPVQATKFSGSGTNTLAEGDLFTSRDSGSTEAPVGDLSLAKQVLGVRGFSSGFGSNA